MDNRIINQQAAQIQGISEKMNAVDQMAWVGQMDNIRTSAMEFADKETIYAGTISKVAAGMIPCRHFCL